MKNEYFNEYFTEQVFTRLTKTQNRQMRKAAKSMKESPSEWIRAAILTKIEREAKK